MRSVRDAENAVALIALVDLLLAEMPGSEIRIDGVRVDHGDVRALVRRSVERVCSGKIGAA